MYSYEVTNSLGVYFASILLKRKSKKKVKVKQNIKEKNRSDFIDYDGMGNYGRFPCKKK